MKVQHPEKRQHSIDPKGGEPILTDENGVADVPDDIAKSLLDQDWVKVTDKPKKES